MKTIYEKQQQKILNLSKLQKTNKNHTNGKQELPYGKKQH
jgi:hypothetical protein